MNSSTPSLDEPGPNARVGVRLDVMASTAAASLPASPPALPSAWSAPAPALGNPYPGLCAFKPEAHRTFFGRDEDTARVIDRLTRTRLVSIVGRSGTGKSSLVAAGVVPCLAERVGHLRYLRFEPQADPFRQLADALCHPSSDAGPNHGRRRGDAQPQELARAGESLDSLVLAIESYLACQRRPFLLLIDQFEELFTLTPPDWAHRFRALFASLLSIESVYLVLTLRCEFAGRLLEWLGEDLFRASLLALEPIRGNEQLHAIITGPAAASGVPVQAELVSTLIAAARATHGALPLIALALERLFAERDPEQGLTLAAYQRMGGLESAVQSAAAGIEELIGGRPELEAACERLFAELATVIDELPTRRTVEVAALRADPLVGLLVDALRRQGFLVDVDDRHVELAHEALLVHWPRLRQWCARYSESLALRRQAKQAAREWQHRGGRKQHAAALRWNWERQKPVLLALLGLSHRNAPVDPDFTDPGVDAWRSLEGSLDIVLRDFLRPEPLALLEELAADATPHHRREEIGLRLNQMGDPRRGVGLAADGLPDFAWIDVAAGDVVLEGRGGQAFAVKPFRVAKYPITWRQYNVFLRADDGYSDRRWWRKLRQRKQPGEARWGFPNYPAINVCWSDAIAYCRWLNARWHLVGPQVLRLPNEWEWQWLAQGACGKRKFPWGDDWNAARANSHESGVGRTTAVGMYPLGMPAGLPVADLAGNVWEWCLNDYHSPRDTHIGGDAPRALRGGSWLDFPADLSTGKRNEFAPDDRDGDIGFRVVLASPFE